MKVGPTHSDPPANYDTQPTQRKRGATHPTSHPTTATPPRRPPGTPRTTLDHHATYGLPSPRTHHEGHDLPPGPTRRRPQGIRPDPTPVASGTPSATPAPPSEPAEAGPAELGGAPSPDTAERQRRIRETLDRYRRLASRRSGGVAPAPHAPVAPAPSAVPVEAEVRTPAPFQTAEEHLALGRKPVGSYVRHDGVVMRRPSHGKGALRVGGPGRPPRAIRQAFAASFEERLWLAEAIADDPTAPAAERLAALDLIGHYGVGRATAQLDDKGRAVGARKVVVRFDQRRERLTARPDYLDDDEPADPPAEAPAPSDEGA